VTPELLVTAIIVCSPSPNRPAVLVPGTEKVTFTPGAGFP
jgi:hypothetical protein